MVSLLRLMRVLADDLDPDDEAAGGGVTVTRLDQIRYDD